MTGKILTGSLLSLTLLACAAFGCQGACGSLEQETVGQVETQENEMDWRATGQTDVGSEESDESDGGNTEAMSEVAAKESASAQIADFPIINQMPELPTGCEITALTMALNVTGSSPEELYERVSQGQRVVVWVTISMADRGSTEGWYTENGDYVDWSTNDHGAVLVGYTETTVTIADPISGRMEYAREQFEEVFASRDSQCVVLESDA